MVTSALPDGGLFRRSSHATAMDGCRASALVRILCYTEVAMNILFRSACALACACLLSNVTLAQNAFVFYADQLAINEDSRVIGDGSHAAHARQALDYADKDAPQSCAGDKSHSYHCNHVRPSVAYYAEMEVFYARATRADGQQDSAGGDAQFDYEASPRLTIGAMSDTGLGIRGRVWDYSHTTGVPSVVIVDTLTADLEVFERIDLTCTTSVEWSAGVRYTDFLTRRLVGAFDHDNSEGWGGTFGLQLNRCWLGGELYGRARYSILHIEDGTFDTIAGPQLDMVRGQTEIGLGYAYCYVVWGVATQLRAGYEWQLWENFTSNDNFGITTPVDVGFDGFVIGATLEF